MVKLLKRLTKREVGMFLISVVFVFLNVYLELKIPDYMSEITRLITEGHSGMSEILKNGAYMMACAFGSFAALIIVGFFAARIAATFSKTIRAELFDKVGHFSQTELNKFSTASLITRSTNDVTQMQMVIALGLQVFVKAPIMAVWAIIKISNKSWEWTTATGVAVVFLMIMISIIVTSVRPKFSVIQKLTDKLNSLTRENLLGIRVVRAYNAEQYQQDKFEKTNEDVTRTNRFVNRVLALISPTMMLISSGLSLAIYWIGSYLIEAAQGMERMTIFSDMVVFSSYAMQVVMSFMMLTMIFIILPRAAVSAGRINEVLDTKSVIKDGTITSTPEGIRGAIEFKNVSFKYPDASKNVIENVSFKATKGQTIAFIGSTGSGKSTLVSLIPRFYDATEGEILVDDVNIEDLTLKTLHNKVGFIPQKPVLFSGTIKSNTQFGDSGDDKPSDAEINTAVKLAQAADFVDKLPETINAPITQGGTNVSGGQKQRLAIARALARKPEILVFDDSFSALDYKTDRNLREELSKETGDVTKLIVAQRIGTIMDADLILVLDKGQVVGEGTHSELLKNNAIYKEIAYSQLSEEELANA